MADSITFSEAARRLGLRTRSSLYRLRDDGRLVDYLADGGGLIWQPPGLPSLADHIAAVSAPRGQHRRQAEGDGGSGGESIASIRAKAEARVALERARSLRLTNDAREGELVNRGDWERATFATFRAARDRLQRIALPVSLEAIGLGLPADRSADLRRLVERSVREALEQFTASRGGLRGLAHGERRR